MKRKESLYICGSLDFFCKFKRLFSVISDVSLFHIGHLPEILLIEEVPSAWIFESECMSGIDKDLFQKISYKIQSSLSLGLIITPSVEEVFFWRQNQYRPFYLMFGSFDAQQILERIHCLYEDRFAFHTTKILILADPNHEHALIEKELRDHGLTVRVVNPHEVAILPEILLAESVRFFVWNLSADLPEGATIYQIIKKDAKLKSLKMYFLKNKTAPKKNQIKKFTKASRDLFDVKDVKKLIARILKDVHSEFQTPTIYRDQRCGILSEKYFNEYLHKNLITKYLRVGLSHLDEVRAHWGDILVHGLENDLAFYIKSHVRISDVVGRGERGEILLACHSSDDYLLAKVAERIKQGFYHEILESLDIIEMSVDCQIVSLDGDCDSEEFLSQSMVNLPFKSIF